MGIPSWKRMARRTGRRFARMWSIVQVTWRGNDVQRRVDFEQPIAHPILLIQGFGSSRRALRVLEKRLRADGYEVLSVRLGGMFGTLNTRRIPKAAELIAGKMASWRERGTLGKFTIIGHSKGGFIARYMTACLNAAEHVETIITMGTPHQGYPKAQLARVSRLGVAMPSVRQMRPSSPFFRKLTAHTMPKHVRCVSLASNYDRVVPEELSRWGDDSVQFTNRTLEGVTHTDYLVKHRVYEAVREYLP